MKKSALSMIDRDLNLEQKIVGYVEHNSPITIEEILKQFPNPEARDSLYWLLYEFKLFIRIEVQDLTREDECLVFPDYETAQAWQFKDRSRKKKLMVACLRRGAKFELDGRILSIIDTIHETHDVLYDCDGKINTMAYEAFESLVKSGDLVPVTEEQPPGTPLGLMQSISSKRLKVARERMDMLMEYREGKKQCSRAKYYRLEKCWRIGNDLGQPLLGFVPKIRPGNRTPRHSEATLNFVNNYVLRSHLGVKALKDGYKEAPGKRSGNAYISYHDYKIQAKEMGVGAVGQRKFRAIINDVPLEDRERASKGFRAANAARVSNNDDHAYEREPEFAGEVAHIDCARRAVKLKLENGKTIKLIVSKMIDGYSACVTGYAVSVKGSSRRLLMSTIRDHAMQFGYIPHRIYYDRGTDYTSHANHMMSQDIGVQIDFCPVGNPRSHFQIERSFRTDDIDFVHNLPGSTQYENQSRRLSKGYRADDHASISLFKFFELLEQSINDYNTAYNSSLGNKGRSPMEAFLRSRNDPRRTKAQLSPIIDIRHIYAATLLPVTRKGTRLNSRGSIQHQNRYYRCDELEMPKNMGKKLRVKWDPFDPRHVFVEIGDEWFRARCKNYALMECWSEIETRCNALEMYGSNSRFGISELRAAQSAQRRRKAMDKLDGHEATRALDDMIAHCANEKFTSFALPDEKKIIPDDFEFCEVPSEEELADDWNDEECDDQESWA